MCAIYVRGKTYYASQELNIQYNSIHMYLTKNIRRHKHNMLIKNMQYFPHTHIGVHVHYLLCSTDLSYFIDIVELSHVRERTQLTLNFSFKQLQLSVVKFSSMKKGRQ